MNENQVFELIKAIAGAGAFLLVVAFFWNNRHGGAPK